MDKIKLVIWDLDETFWNGTLSEEGVEPINKNIELVKELTDRGIINSIVSKNNFEQAKKKLIELGVWDYFIFPSIEWAPKGKLIKETIEKCQLRDVNVLFLDDNHLNLEEAKFYNPDLHVKTPAFINKISSHKAFEGKDDRKHSRLKQYKILEKKHDARTDFNDNVEFLRSSNIQIEIIEDLEGHKDRIHELISRTNQLNFTKIRSSEDEIEKLLNAANYSSAVIKVQDKFGDYGVVGFYSINNSENKLKHFVFSCRILNLGVTQYIYSKLGFPSLDIVPEVAEDLDESSPNWISEKSYNRKKNISQTRTDDENREKVLFKGGCDLVQTLFYLTDSDFSIIEETNYVSEENFPIHQEHTQVLIDSQEMSKKDKEYIENSFYIPFTDQNFYNTKVFDGNYSCLIYSLLMDYTQEMYKHKSRGFLLPFGGYDDWTEKKNHSQIIKNYQDRNIKNVNEEVLKKFGAEFEHVGKITPEYFVRNLEKLRSYLPGDIPMIFFNGAEIKEEGSEEKGSYERHIVMNNALDQFIQNSSNSYLVDVREFVVKKSQLKKNIRHYNRETYKKISLRLLNILNTVVDSRINTNLTLGGQIKSLISYSRRYLGRIKNKLT